MSKYPRQSPYARWEAFVRAEEALQQHRKNHPATGGYQSQEEESEEEEGGRKMSEYVVPDGPGPGWKPAKMNDGWAGSPEGWVVEPNTSHRLRYCSGDLACPTRVWVPMAYADFTVYCPEHRPEGSIRVDVREEGEGNE